MMQEYNLEDGATFEYDDDELDVFVALANAMTEKREQICMKMNDCERSFIMYGYEIACDDWDNPGYIEIINNHSRPNYVVASISDVYHDREGEEMYDCLVGALIDVAKGEWATE